MENISRIQEAFGESEKLFKTLHGDATLHVQMQDLSRRIAEVLGSEHGKVLICGNGGSAAEAQHLAAELTGKFYIDREPLRAEALHVDTSYLTAVANDYSYDETYARLIRAKGKPGDVLIALSTSGTSKNIVLAAQEAQKQKMFVVGMTGESGGALKEWCNMLFAIPSRDTPRIQEAHLLIGHTLCELVEQKLFTGKEVIVIAGGKGARLQSVVNDIPKPMALVSGRPFLEWLLDRALEYDVRAIVLSVGYKYETIIEHFGDSYRGVPIRYAVETEPLGTGGGLKKATELLESDYAVVLNGDTMFQVNLDELCTMYHKKRSDVVIALKEIYNSDRYGVVERGEDNRVTGFREKEYVEQGYINGGVYVVRKKVLEPHTGVFSFETDVLQKRCHDIAVHGHASEGYFIDIGIPEDYARAQHEFLRVHPKIVGDAKMPS